MNGDRESAKIQENLPPLATLLIAYAPPARRDWHRLCWTLDQRLAAVVRRGGDPTIAAIRLAWWDEVLVAGDRGKGGGEPLVEAWRRAAAPQAAPLVERLIDGWRALLGADMPSLADIAYFGERRGGGLFGLIGGDDNELLTRAGTVWALWDLAGHVSDPALAESALEEAHQAAAGYDISWRRDRSAKPLRLLYGLARADALAKRRPRGFEARHYRALLWRSLFP